MRHQDLSVGRHNIFGALACAAVVTVLAPSAVGGECYVADVPFEVVLPGGATHEPGPLTVCFRSKASPVQSVFEIMSDGMPMGWYLARTYAAESGALYPIGRVVFAVTRSGRMHLLRVVVAGPGGAAMIHDFAVADDEAAAWAPAAGSIKIPTRLAD